MGPGCPNKSAADPQRHGVAPFVATELSRHDEEISTSPRGRIRVDLRLFPLVGAVGTGDFLDGAATRSGVITSSRLGCAGPPPNRRACA